MEIHDNIDLTPYAAQKIKYGSKYAQLFSEFLQDSTLQSREIPLNSLSKTQSCEKSLQRLIRQYHAEDTIQIQANMPEKKVVLIKTKSPQS